MRATTYGTALILTLGLAGAAQAGQIGVGDNLGGGGGGTIEVDIGGGGPIRIDLEGDPFGPGNTDTIIRRTETPGTIPSGNTGTIDIELFGLSLRSVNLIDIGGTSYDVWVTLDSANASEGTLDFDTHDDGAGGGTFDSYIDIFLRLDFKDTSNPSNDFFVYFEDEIQATGSLWSHTAPALYPNLTAYPSGGVHLGVDPATGLRSGITFTGTAFDMTFSPAVVPLPPAAYTGMALLGLLGLSSIARRRRGRAQR